MNLLISGATGLIGTAASQFFRQNGARIWTLTRSSSSDPLKIRWNPSEGTLEWPSPPPVFNAVIHLAGESIMGRWTASKRRRIRESRVRGTRLLCRALVRLPEPPAVLLSASAIGYYGDAGATVLPEDASPGASFLAEVCQEWEGATVAAEEAGIRVCHMRFAIVLSAAGGALSAMLPVFKLGLGGRVGDGRQYWSWISVDDAVRAMAFLIDAGAVSGPVNFAHPVPVQNSEFTHALARQLHRPAWVPVPSTLIKVMLGAMGRALLLASVRVNPEKLMAHGFKFEDASLKNAFERML